MPSNNEEEKTLYVTNKSPSYKNMVSPASNSNIYVFIYSFKIIFESLIARLKCLSLVA